MSTDFVRRMSREEAMWGPEPQWEGTPTRLAFIKAMGWYNHFHSQQEAHAFFLKWAEHAASHEFYEGLQRCPFYLVPHTLGWMAHLKVRGMQFDHPENDYFDRRCAEVERDVQLWLESRERLGTMGAHIKVPANMRAQFEKYLDAIQAEIIEGVTPVQKWFSTYDLKPSYISLILEYWTGFETEDARLLNVRQCIIANCQAKLATKAKKPAATKSDGKRGRKKGKANGGRL